MDAALKKIVDNLKPALDASLDPACILDTSGKIVSFNFSMKGFLVIPARELKKNLVLTDLIKLTVPNENSTIAHLLKTGEQIKLDETPATRGDTKLRILFRAVALFDPDKPKSLPIGALITLRDSTGEVLLQAKYHKVSELLHEREVQVSELETKLESFRTALRNARTIKS